MISKKFENVSAQILNKIRSSEAGNKAVGHLISVSCRASKVACVAEAHVLFKVGELTGIKTFQQKAMGDLKLADRLNTIAYSEDPVMGLTVQGMAFMVTDIPQMIQENGEAIEADLQRLAAGLHKLANEIEKVSNKGTVQVTDDQILHEDYSGPFGN
jgi:hypothetical protein